MPNILIRDVPDDLYQMITRRAKQEHRTIPSEVLHIVEQNLRQQDVRRAQHHAAGAKSTQQAIREATIPF